MTDIYLNCNSSNLKIAQTIKKEVESRSQFSVSVENDDSWHEEDECDFLDKVDMAKQMIIIHTEDRSTITAWVIDQNFYRLGSRGLMALPSKPQKVDFSGSSHRSGMKTLLYLLQQQQPNGKKGRKMTKKSNPMIIFSKLFKHTKNTTRGLLLLFWQAWVLFAK